MKLGLILILILLLGAPAFGLEALFLGGGKTSIFYKNKFNLLKSSIVFGLVIVGIPIGIDLMLLELKPLYLITLTITLTFIFAGTISIINGEKTNKKKFNTEITDNNEIKTMLKSKGLEDLIEKENKSESE